MSTRDASISDRGTDTGKFQVSGTRRGAQACAQPTDQRADGETRVQHAAPNPHAPRQQHAQHDLRHDDRASAEGSVPATPHGGEHEAELDAAAEAQQPA